MYMHGVVYSIAILPFMLTLLNSLNQNSLTILSKWNPRLLVK